jgi:hypothetical protein
VKYLKKMVANFFNFVSGGFLMPLEQPIVLTSPEAE